MVREIRWTLPVQKKLFDIYYYLLNDSVKYSEKVKAEILASTIKLADNPEYYPPDKYKTNNDNSFRAYEIHHYRISYYFTDTKVTILRIRHTKMVPQFY